MSAEPIPVDRPGQSDQWQPDQWQPGPWQPDPARQHRADYTVEDLLRLPPDAPRVELVDGVLHGVPSPSIGHQDIAGLLWMWLRRHAPDHLTASLAVSVGLTLTASRQPDVLLRNAGVDLTTSLIMAHDVILAVEVVSPGTRRTDRFLKPREYAAAEIPFYWRVEQDPVHVYAYRLGGRTGPEGRRDYEPMADSAELLELAKPFEIKLPIAEITP